MLVELSMRNFALIPSLTVTLEPGFNVLTGETGAGKSMIVDAISLLVGGRASVDYVRHGHQKAEIEGLFSIPDNHPARSLLSELGIELEDDMLILRRDISTKGKNICRINGKLVTLAVLREVGQLLVDIQGQHEHQHLLVEDRYLPLLDEYGKGKISPHKQEYVTLFHELKKLNRAIKQLNENEQQLAQRLDLFRYQYQEIAAAQLEPGEDEELEKEKRIKGHAQKLYQGMEQTIAALYGDGRALDSLAVAMNELQECAAIDESLEPYSEKLESLYYQVEDILHECRKYAENIEFDPERLNHIESRLVQIEQLKRKYGQTVEEILAYAAKIEEELDTLEHREERTRELMEQKQNILLDLAVEAEHLTRIRKEVAQDLIQAIKQELAGLYMDQTEIEMRFSPLSAGSDQVEHRGGKRWISQEGWDQIDWLIAPNPGEPPKPLAKIASGGELSRLLLALKTVFAKLEPVTSLIFDEIDTGVSGRVVQAMAEKLYTISLNRQVICITHQPQMAAMADHHLYIHKQTNEGGTETTVVPLDREERQMEIARMISGHHLTEATKEHVQELVQQAENIKADLKEKLSK
ncbi:DNA repair protein RecN (Recombination protein N) [Caldalkalibacillus uzonensis]|uniref:DNA repair protein RecN n=1 Tax=Caldalkalibacillus uzonensis TaxID=353224 RepID=A0ABU0CMS2_9BACI|nr:DNA repair protein RecN [Caldalkalibacillus uzonensis]MDQ0337716.1 DNA repair protein RecN (Recombination protein N) [Caldalkalibacillus uzonensis]